MVTVPIRALGLECLFKILDWGRSRSRYFFPTPTPTPQPWWVVTTQWHEHVRGNGGTATCVLNLSTRQRVYGHLQAPNALPRGQSLLYPLDWICDGPRWGKSLPLPGTEPLFPGSSACRPVTILTELPQLPYYEDTSLELSHVANYTSFLTMYKLSLFMP
jgi:hypothetical protein